MLENSKKHEEQIKMLSEENQQIKRDYANLTVQLQHQKG